MGRPIGSLNRERPFNDALRMALRRRPLALHRIADKLLDKAEEGDLPSAREVADRLDGKPAQTVDYGNLTVEQMTDAQLRAIAAGGSPDTVMKALPPPRK